MMSMSDNDSMKLRVAFDLKLNLDGEVKKYRFTVMLESLKQIDSLTKVLLTDKRVDYIESERLD